MLIACVEVRCLVTVGEMQPERRGLGVNLIFDSLPLAVEEKVAESAAEELVHNHHEKIFVEFEECRLLAEELIDAVDEEQKDWRLLVVFFIDLARMSAALIKLMSSTAPLLFDEQTEALQSAIVRIEHEKS